MRNAYYVSWPSGYKAHQVVVIDQQSVGSNHGRDTCVLKQDTQPWLLCESVGGSAFCSTSQALD